MVVSNLSTLYTVLADNYSLPPQHVITRLASQSLPTPMSHPLHVPNPMSGTGEGWRRKDCPATLVWQDGQRLAASHCCVLKEQARWETFKKPPRGREDKCR